MESKIIQAVNNIFMEYEETPELVDFKEEIVMNLSEHVRDMTKKGLSEEDALNKALAELGDVTEAANEVSRQKRKEIIGQAYVRSVPLDKLHAIGYPVLGLVLAFGLIVCFISAFTTDSVMKAIATLMPFAVLSIGGFVYLGLTQETRTQYAMSKKRSLLYTASSVLLSLGAFFSGITLFVDIAPIDLTNSGIAELKGRLIAANPVATLGTLIPFVLPAIALLAFLILTEKSRKKPWVLRMEEESMQIYGESFGLLSGAVWICAIALFVLLGMLIGWHISWVVFLFALAAQMVVQATIANKHGK